MSYKPYYSRTWNWSLVSTPQPKQHCLYTAQTWWKKTWKMLPLERIWHYIIINLWSYFESYWLWLILKNFGLVFQTDLPSRSKNLSTDIPPPIVWMIHILWKRGCVKTFFQKGFYPIANTYYILFATVCFRFT